VNEPAPAPEPEGIPFSRDDKAAFYARARGSATESAAVLDLCAQLNLLPAALCQEHKARLKRVAQMLTKLVRAHQGS
jgi:four helix bundle protein